jgi:glyoxylase-like metal-dependent hydrolase (beta-lactamase superfamily II)
MSHLMPGVHVVDDVAMAGRPGTVNVCLLIWKGEGTLVDAGFPGITGPLLRTLEEVGIAPAAVRRIIVTHHHSDHTGGLAEAVALTGAEVWAHEDDAGFIDGTATRPGPRPEVLAQMQAGMSDEQRAAAVQRHMTGPEPVPVTLRLAGGETLDVHGGLRVLHTPGHTPGHLSLFLPELSLLLAGDLLRYENGTVTTAPDRFNADSAEETVSALSVIPLGFEHMLPYHGDYLGSDAAAITRRDIG